MRRIFKVNFVLVLLLGFVGVVSAQNEVAEKTLPVVKDGETQIVEGFKNSQEWIRHDLWVVTESNTDGDNQLDRVHVSVCRPKQTQTEGLKVAAIYNTSPYFFRCCRE